MKKAFIISTILFTILSCSTSEKYQQIAGHWECATWINESQDIDRCNDNVFFNFETDKTYRSQLGSAQDSGTFKIVGDKLYVTPEGKMEFAVRITHLTSDTLQMLMNQAGEEEILTLVKPD